MSYEFECKNVVPGCEGKVEGASTEEVMQAVAQHAGDAHGLTDLDAATIEKVKAGIVQTD